MRPAFAGVLLYPSKMLYPDVLPLSSMLDAFFANGTDNSKKLRLFYIAFGWSVPLSRSHAGTPRCSRRAAFLVVARILQVATLIIAWTSGTGLPLTANVELLDECPQVRRS